MKAPTSDRARALFDYDPETGIFRWRWRPRYDFKREQDWLQWNSKYAGVRAGHLSLDGYRYLKIDGFRHGEHRIAWLYCHGYIPDQIDHENGRTSENWLSNLRDVTVADNAKNQKRRITNQSGVTGICADGKRWRAYITVDHKNIRLGIFDQLCSAIEARLAAERQHGFHRNHGRAPL